MRSDIEFTSGGVQMRGWLYRPDQAEGKTPLVVMAPAFAAIKEWIVPSAEVFSESGIACLVYDHPSFGDSEGEPRQEADPIRQIEAYRDALTYAQLLDGIDPDRLGVWGTSYSGAHVLVVAATDRRVRAVVSQVPLTQGLENLRRLAGPEDLYRLQEEIAKDRRARMEGQPHAMVEDNPVPGQESAEWTAKKKLETPQWREELTLSSVDKWQSYTPEAYVARISPTPLMMILTTRDEITPTHLQIESYMEAREPKELVLAEGNHCSIYEENFERASTSARDFFHRHL